MTTYAMDVRGTEQARSTGQVCPRRRVRSQDRRGPQAHPRRFEVTGQEAVVSRVAAAQDRPASSGVQITERGMAVAVTLMGGSMVAAAVTIATQFLAILGG